MNGLHVLNGGIYEMGLNISMFLCRNKESPLPFPSQHPCTSHISQFAVFPDTRNAVNTPLHLQKWMDWLNGRICMHNLSHTHLYSLSASAISSDA